MDSLTTLVQEKIAPSKSKLFDLLSDENGNVTRDSIMSFDPDPYGTACRRMEVTQKVVVYLRKYRGKWGIKKQERLWVVVLTNRDKYLAYNEVDGDDYLDHLKEDWHLVDQMVNAELIGMYRNIGECLRLSLNDAMLFIKKDEIKAVKIPMRFQCNGRKVSEPWERPE